MKINKVKFVIISMVCVLGSISLLNPSGNIIYAVDMNQAKTMEINREIANTLITNNLYNQKLKEEVVTDEIIENKVIEETVELTIEQHIQNACSNYGIPFDITLAIARLETGWFKSLSYINGNNPGGLSKNEVPMAFDTIEEGVDAFVCNLANNYFAIGLDTPYAIGQKYCPVNPNWANLVSELMTYGYNI